MEARRAPSPRDPTRTPPAHEQGPPRRAGRRGPVLRRRAAAGRPVESPTPPEAGAGSEPSSGVDRAERKPASRTAESLRRNSRAREIGLCRPGRPHARGPRSSSAVRRRASDVAGEERSRSVSGANRSVGSRRRARVHPFEEPPVLPHGPPAPPRGGGGRTQLSGCRPVRRLLRSVLRVGLAKRRRRTSSTPSPSNRKRPSRSVVVRSKLRPGSSFAHRSESRGAFVRSAEAIVNGNEGIGAPSGSTNTPEAAVRPATWMTTSCGAPSVPVEKSRLSEASSRRPRAKAEGSLAFQWELEASIGLRSSLAKDLARVRVEQPH